MKKFASFVVFFYCLIRWKAEGFIAGEVRRPRQSSSWVAAAAERSDQRLGDAATTSAIRVNSTGNHPLLSLNLNLDSLAKSNEIGAAGRAQELLQRIEALHKEGYYAVAPDTVSYNSVLNAWARSNDADGATRAMELFLSEMIDKKDIVEPNVITFNIIIWAFAKRGMAEEASDVFESMQEEYNVAPNTVSFNALLYAMAEANQAEACEALFKRMVRMSLTNESCKPDTVSFNTLLHAWASTWDPRGPRRAEEILQHMERLHQAGNVDVVPDVYSYTTVIQVWTKSSGGAMRAKALLERMERECESRPEVTPNAKTYTCVICAMAKSRRQTDALEANRILERMWSRYQDGDNSAKPDAVAFTAVISCWSSINQQHGRDYGADEVVLELLERMKTLGEQGHEDMAPNARTYTSVLKTLSNSQKSYAYDKAMWLLDEMETSFQEGNLAVEPSNFHYNAILDLIARGSFLDKVGPATELFREMKALGRESVRPNIITYNSLLRVCANTYGGSEEKQEALKLAIELFRKVLRDDSMEASSITFLFFFKCVRKHGRVDPQFQLKVFQHSFDYCCKRGLLSDYILAQLKMALTADVLKGLLGLESIPNELSVSDLPSEWSRNGSIGDR